VRGHGFYEEIDSYGVSKLSDGSLYIKSLTKKKEAMFNEVIRRLYDSNLDNTESDIFNALLNNMEIGESHLLEQLY
jgi:hypothetical protein